MSTYNASDIAKTLAEVEEATENRPSGTLCLLGGLERILAWRAISIPMTQDFLTNLANRFQQEPEGVDLLLKVAPHLYGLIYISDNWIAPERQTLSDYQELVELHGSVEKIPGARRGRILSCVDLDGRAYLLTRRGSERYLACTGNGDPIGGPATQALRQILIAAALKLPDGDHALDALARLRLTEWNFAMTSKQ